MKMKPLFMWAGGKTRLIKKYKEKDVLPKDFNSYIEPFLGGGAMFIWAYQKNPNADFVLNDINKGIISIYDSIKNDCEVFIEHLEEMSSIYIPLDKGERRKDLEKEYTTEHYVENREEPFKQPDWNKIFSICPSRRHYYFKLRAEHAFEYKNWSKTKEAAVLYFLMKTGFNGIWQENKSMNGRFGTPSGLLNQKTKVFDKDNVLLWKSALQNVKLLSGDFTDTLSYASSGTFVFLDPPYRGSFTQYGVDFDDDLQESVIQYFNDSIESGAYSLMSNRDVNDGFFEDRKGKNKIIRFDVTYTAGRRKMADGGG
jgi:DNA adenine methylase